MWGKTAEAQRQSRPGQRQGGGGGFSEEDIRRFRARSEAGLSQSMIKGGQNWLLQLKLIMKR